MEAMHAIAKIAMQSSRIIVGIVSSILSVDGRTKRSVADDAAQIASHWRAVGGYIRSAMDKESGNGIS